VSCQRIMLSCQELNVWRRYTCHSLKKNQNAHRQKTWRDGRKEMLKINLNKKEKEIIDNTFSNDWQKLTIYLNYGSWEGSYQYFLLIFYDRLLIRYNRLTICYIKLVICYDKLNLKKIMMWPFPPSVQNNINLW